MTRILLAGVLGGIVIFVWGAVSHMVLGTDEWWLRQIPNEEALMGVMKASLTEPGMYFFPGMDMSHKPSEAEEAAWTERYKVGPTGLLVYHPQGSEPMTPVMLGIELASNIAGALIGAFILAQIAGGFGSRLLVSTMLGFVSWVNISVSYWNWYGFSLTFTAAEALDQTAGWLLAGLVMALIVKPSRT